MTDSDKTKGGNMVIDEIGRKLIEEGSWTDDIQFEVFSDRVFRDLLAKIARDKIGKELHEVQEGFIRFLKDPATFEKLEQPVNNGLPLTDAVSDLFQKEYLPFVESSNDDQFVEDPDDEKFFNKDNIHATRLKNKISKLIRENKADDFVRKQWGNETNLELVYNHYCHLLSKNDEELLKRIKIIAKNDNKPIAKVIIDCFKNDYILRGKKIYEKDKNIKDLSYFFQLIANQTERDKYIWDNREDSIRIHIEKKLKSLFKPISDYVKLEDVTTQMKTKFKVNFTGKNGDRGEEFILGYAFEKRETFEAWSQRMTMEYIDTEFETALRTILSAESFENFIKGNKKDHYVLCEKVTKLFHLLKVGSDPIILRHYCRLLINDKFSGLTAKINNVEGSQSIAVVLAIVLYFEDAYRRKEQILSNEDREKLYTLLGDKDQRNDYLWYSRKEDIKLYVIDKLKEVYDSLHLNMSTKNDCDVIMDSLRSALTDDFGLRFLQGYSFDHIEKWLKEKSEEMINEKCVKYINQNIHSKLGEYYLSTDIDVKTRFQRMEILAKDYIPSDKFDKIIREVWGLDPDEDTSLVYEHYFYTLVNGGRKSFKNVLKEFKGGKKKLKECFRNDFMTYLDDGKSYLDKGIEYKIMSDKANRESFFNVLKMSKSQLDKHLYGKKKNFDKRIRAQIKDVYSHLVFTGKPDNKQQLKEQTDKKKMAIKKLHEDLKAFLIGDAGWEFVRNYSFKEKFEEWCNHIIDNFIEAKPRIDLFIKERDSHILKSYITNEKEFGYSDGGKPVYYFLTVYNDFRRLGSSSIAIDNFITASNRRPRISSFYEITDKGLVKFINDEVQKFITYFYSGLRDDRLSKKLNEEWGCEKLFEKFRFESRLSSYMYEICKNYYMGLVKQEFPSQFVNPRRKEILNLLKKVYEKEPVTEQMRKANKDKVINKYLDLIKQELQHDKKQPSIPTDKEIRKELKKTLPLVLKQNLGPVSKEDSIPDVDTVINSVLVNYAWLFFDFRKDNFSKTEEMHAYFQGLAEYGNWRFFNPEFVEFEIDDIKEVRKDMENKFIKVLPKLVAFCHIQYLRYHSIDGGIAVRNKEKTDFKTLAKYYKTSAATARGWYDESKKEFKAKVYPFFNIFTREILSIDSKKNKTTEEKWLLAKLYKVRDEIPMVLNQICKLFLPDSIEEPRYQVIQSEEKIVKKRDSLQINKTYLNKRNPQLTDGMILANQLISGNMDLETLATDLENRLLDMNPIQIKTRNKF